MARVLLAEGREAEVFAWGEANVLRLMRDGEPRESMERGVAAMRAAEACGVPVPHIDEVVVVDGRPGVVMDRIDGQDLLTVLETKPWKVARAARDLGELHARLHETVAPAGLVPLREHARRRIEGSVLPRTLVRFAIAALDELPDGDRLLHGDYHPGNVLIGSSGPVIIDWSNATRGDPAADVARTRLMLRLGDPPPGSSRLLRQLAGLGRGYFAWAYVRSYRKHAAMDDAMLDRWEVVRAADRISEEIEPEIPTLVELLERAERAASG